MAALGVERGNRILDGAVEVLGAGEGLVRQAMPLQVAPEGFDVVQFWGVFRQPLDGEPVRPRGEGSARCPAGVDRAVVEHEDNRSHYLARPWSPAPVDLLQEREEVRAAFGSAGLNMEV